MRRGIRSLCIAFAISAGLEQPLSAADATVNLRLAHWLPQSHPLHQSFVAWADSIRKASNGSIVISIFPSEQLGKAFDGYDMGRDDIADISLVNPGYQPGRFPITAAPEIPFTISDAKRGSRAVDAWYRPYAAKEMRDVHFCVAFLRANAYFQSRTKPIVVPADIRGMRVRPSDGTVAKFVTLLGGANVQAAAPSSRDLLERGVADATVFPWGSTTLFGVEQAVKYHLDMPTEVGFFNVVINKGAYDRLSVDQRAVIDQHCTNEWATKLNDPWVDFEEAGLSKIAKLPGHEIIKPTAEQAQQWRDSAKPLKDSWAADVTKSGGDAAAILKDLDEQLAAENARF